MNKTVLGFFDDNTQAEHARNELIADGIDSSDIKVFSSSSVSDFEQSGKTNENLSFTERIKYFFKHLGDWNISDEHANAYAEGIRRGGYVVSVNTEEDQIDRAADILERSGAVDINRRNQFYKETGYQSFDANAEPYSLDQSRDYRNQYQNWEKDKFAGNKEEVIPVIEENVRVGKRPIEKGRVRILTKVTETPVEEQVRLRDERVDVQRRPVDRALNTADMGAFKEGEIELRETAEEPIVEKEARVVEEVVVSKQAKERTETVRDKARKTDVKVERGDADRRLTEESLKKENLRSTDKI